MGITCCRNLLYLPALVLLVGGCGPEAPEFLQERRFAMGTWVDIIREATDPATDQALSQQIESVLREWEQDYYAWAEDGELAALNAALGRGQPYTPDPALLALLREAQQLSRLSEGSFDPGVGSLVQSWGFQSVDTLADPVDGAEISAAWQASPHSISALDLSGTTVRSADPDVRIDLGGIAKGAAVDAIVRLLSDAGTDNALVNAGGDLRVLGHRANRPWRVGIQSPRSDALLGSLALEPGEAAFTSGDYERFRESDGDREHHLLDPATGRPAAHTRAVTVIAGSGTVADAAATALFVAGPERWARIAAALGIELALRVDADGTIDLTEQMRDRFLATEDP